MFKIGQTADDNSPRQTRARISKVPFVFFALVLVKCSSLSFRSTETVNRLFSHHFYSVFDHYAVVVGTYGLTAEVGPLPGLLPVLSPCPDAGGRS